MPFRHAISATVDDLIEVAFKERDPLIYDGTQSFENELSDVFADRRMAIVKLYGCLAQASSIRLDPRELAKFCYENAFFSKTVASIVGSSTVLFAGMTWTSIDTTLEAMPDVGEALRTSGPHIVLLREDRSNRGLRATSVMQKYNLDPLEIARDDPRVGYNEGIGAFLVSLSRRWISKRAMTDVIDQHGATLPTAENLKPGEGHLERICLKDIGPFANLELDLSAGWTVFLGDNGVGKSTILRAVALALCGSDASRFADIARKLIRSGSDGTGQIDLTIDGTVHRVDLRRMGSSISFKAPTLSVIEQGTKLVLGFPALRGGSTRSSLSQAPSAQSRPDVADVAPLVQGGVDERLDNLRQWIVDLEARGKTAIRDAFFAVVTDFLKDQTSLRFGRISDSLDVLVWADDELVPFDQLSQGMSSLLAWVGVLIQRMNEVYGDDPSSLERPALVILDELDAHLHPEWQRQLVPVIRRHFPNVQLIATTHSPLVVSALDMRSVLSVTRHRQQIEVRRAEENLTGLRADQVLTSELFGLQSTRSVRYGEKTKTLDDLIRKENSSAAAKQLTSEELELKATLTSELEFETVLGEGPGERAQYILRLRESLEGTDNASMGAVAEFDHLLGGEEA